MHDPEELFTISTISRKDIAEALNDAAECESEQTGEMVTKIADNDPRLTREFCQEWANGLYEIDGEYPEEDEANSLYHEHACEFLEKFLSQSIADAL